MNKTQQKKFDSLYNEHISALQRQGKAPNTIDAYSRAVRRITEFFDRCPDRLDQSDLKDFFTALVKSHSWSTVKIDRNGLQFFYKHVLNKTWVWVEASAPRLWLPASHYLLHPYSRAHAPYLVPAQKSSQHRSCASCARDISASMHVEWRFGGNISIRRRFRARLTAGYFFTSLRAQNGSVVDLRSHPSVILIVDHDY